MKNGFSLVELSIVLVILGLLTGGILAGKSLIHAAELRSVTSEYQRYTAAIGSFRDKYFALPGDMSNATSFWGRADTGAVGSQCATPATDIGTGAQTCNGDGNGLVQTNSEGTMEKFRFWQHLANAGLIEGQYTGAIVSGTYASGVQYPASHLGSAGWETGYLGNFYRYSGVHSLKVASQVTPDTSGLNGPGLSGIDAWNIDAKLDDGIPSSGKMTSLDSATVSGCVSNGTAYTSTTTGTYIYTDTASCRIYFLY